jgi:SlyX protein
MQLLEARIIELESRQAFQDDTIQALNDALLGQQRIIERLQMQLLSLAKRVEEQGGDFPVTQDQAPPPHY